MPAEIIDLVSSPEPEPKVFIKANTTTTDAPTKPLNPVSGTWSFDALSPDGDSIEASSIAKQAAKPEAAKDLTERASNTNGSRRVTTLFSTDGDGLITIDDGDNDIESHNPSDDPFRSPSLPPAKRRRVSSSPQAISVTTVAPKAAGYKRSISNIESSTRIAGTSILKRKNASKSSFDDIVFTSSPDYLAEAARKRKEQKRKPQSGDEDEDNLPELVDLGNYNAKSKACRSTTTPAYTIDENDEEYGYDSTRRSKAESFKSKTKLAEESELPDLDLDSDTVPIKAVRKVLKTTKGSSQSVLDKYNAERAKERVAKDKKEKAAQKAVAKEVEKEKKKLEREEKARQKEKDTEIAKANTRRADKKVSIKEMIVDIPSCLNSKLKDQIQTFLVGKEVAHTEYESTLPVIKWRRNVDREYNEGKGMWDAIPKRIKSEDHIMCLLPAKDLVELVRGDEGQDLDAHALRLKAKFDSCRIIYLIEGFSSWTRKNQNIKKKSFIEAVNSYLPREPPTASQRRKKNDDEYVDEEMVEDAFLKLQVVHGALIHHTLVTNETAEKVVTFTEQISLRPEKLKSQTLDTTFCMETGQVKTGDDPTDTFVKMLQEMVRVTQSVAWGIVSEYPTVQQLVRGFEEHGPTALEHCRKSANGNGAFQDKKVGQKISRRLYHVFMDRTPESTEV